MGLGDKLVVCRKRHGGCSERNVCFGVPFTGIEEAQTFGSRTGKPDLPLGNVEFKTLSMFPRDTSRDGAVQ